MDCYNESTRRRDDGEEAMINARSTQGNGNPQKGEQHIDQDGPALPGNQLIPQLGRYHFKRAETLAEMEQVHRLNYRTFVKEIHQHPDNGEGRLVDKFHEWNTYFLALLDDRLIGMLSVHDRPPFSIESRLADRSVIQQPGMRPLEVRLLA